jgi:hypothetical protein
MENGQNYFFSAIIENPISDVNIIDTNLVIAFDDFFPRKIQTHGLSSTGEFYGKSIRPGFLFALQFIKKCTGEFYGKSIRPGFFVCTTVHQKVVRIHFSLNTHTHIFLKNTELF